MKREPGRVNKRWWYALLLVPLIATLIPPFYVRSEPQLLGFPFFYWYQLLWVILASAVTWIVFVATREAPRD